MPTKEYQDAWKERNPDYHSKYHKLWRKNVRDRAVKILGGECSVCGSDDRLEIDHIDRSDKVTEVGSLASNEEKFIAELKKCQLLCHDCHMKKTVEERGQTLAKGTHGTLSSIRYCKCDICKEAYREYQREYRKKNKKAKEESSG